MEAHREQLVDEFRALGEKLLAEVRQELQQKQSIIPSMLKSSSFQAPRRPSMSGGGFRDRRRSLSSMELEPRRQPVGWIAHEAIVRETSLNRRRRRSAGGQMWRPSEWLWSIRSSGRERSHTGDTTDSEKAASIPNDDSSGCNLGEMVVPSMDAEYRERAWLVLDSQHFGMIIFTVLVLNAIFIGFQVDSVAQAVGETMPFWTVAISHAFTLFFTAELCLRIYVWRTEFFMERGGWKWNIFEAGIVLFDIIETCLELLVPESKLASADVSVVRMLRVLRIVKLLRVVRVLRFLHELRTITMSVINSIKSLFWTCVLLGIVLYTFSIFFTQVVTQYRKYCTDPDGCQSLEEHFGSIEITSLSLFKSITGGIDWGEMVIPLMEHVGRPLAFLFCSYIAFTTLAMLNVITGVFVDAALKSAKEDQDNFLTHSVRDLIRGDDGDLESMTSQRFEDLLEDNRLQQYFKAIDVATTEAKGIFKLIDLDSSGEVGAEEFLNGCLKLRGPAKAVDLALLLQEFQSLKRIVKKNLSYDGEPDTEAVPSAIGGSPRYPASPLSPGATSPAGGRTPRPERSRLDSRLVFDEENRSVSLRLGSSHSLSLAKAPVSRGMSFEDAMTSPRSPAGRSPPEVADATRSLGSPANMPSTQQHELLAPSAIALSVSPPEPAAQPTPPDEQAASVTQLEAAAQEVCRDPQGSHNRGAPWAPGMSVRRNSAGGMSREGRKTPTRSQAASPERSPRGELPERSPKDRPVNLTVNAERPKRAGSISKKQQGKKKVDRGS